MVNDFGFESNLLSIIIALFQFPATEVMFVNSSLHVFVLHLKTTRCGDCFFLKLFLANNSSSLVSVQNPYFFIYIFLIYHTHTHTDKAIFFFSFFN